MNLDKPDSEIGIITRALYEGLASSHAEALDDLNRFFHKCFARIVMVGGVVRNGFFCQLAADVCVVEVITGPSEVRFAVTVCDSYLS